MLTAARVGGGAGAAAASVGSAPPSVSTCPSPGVAMVESRRGHQCSKLVTTTARVSASMLKRQFPISLLMKFLLRALNSRYLYKKED